MRHMLRALLSLLIVAWYCSPSAAAEGRRWWPFNRERDGATDLTGNSLAARPTTGAPSTGTPAMTSQHSLPAGQQRSWMPESPLANVSRPRIHLPEMSLPKPRLPRPPWWPDEPQAAHQRNAWTQSATPPARPTPMQTVRQGAQRVRSGTRAAWDKTVDVLTPGDGSSPASQVAAQGTRPSLWTRMFGQEEPPQQGPRTVTEWMAQDRLDP